MNNNELILHFEDGTSSAGLYVYLLMGSSGYGGVRSLHSYMEYSIKNGISFVALTKEYGSMNTVVKVYPIDKVIWFEEADPLTVKRDIKLNELIDEQFDI